MQNDHLVCLKDNIGTWIVREFSLCVFMSFSSIMSMDGLLKTFSGVSISLGEIIN